MEPCACGFDDNDVDARGADEATALIRACFHGHPQCAQALVDAGASLDPVIPRLLIPGIRDSDLTALIVACITGCVECVRVLVRARAMLDSTGSAGDTALIHAVREGHTECARVLVDAGAAVDARNRFQVTALIVTCYTGDTESMRLLVNANASINVADEYQRTALLLACLNNNTECARILVNAGAALDLRCERGITALMSSDMPECTQILVDAGASLDLQAHDGSTALVHMCIRLRPECTRILIKAGAALDLQATDPQGSALYYACRHGDRESACALVEAGASLYLRSGKQFGTALEQAYLLGRFVANSRKPIPLYDHLNTYHGRNTGEAILELAFAAHAAFACYRVLIRGVPRCKRASSSSSSMGAMLCHFDFVLHLVAVTVYDPSTRQRRLDGSVLAQLVCLDGATHKRLVHLAAYDHVVMKRSPDETVATWEQRRRRIIRQACRFVLS